MKHFHPRGKLATCLSRGLVLLLCLLLLSACSSPDTDLPVSGGNVEVVEPKTVTLALCGDNLIHSYIYKVAQENAGGNGFNFLPSYQRVADQIQAADLAFLNQETILGGTELILSGYPLFNSPTELGRDMVALGFDVFNHATNHVLDKGEKGIRNTLDFWASQPDVIAVGLYENEQELNRIHTIERGGVTFAVLAYTYGTNGISLPAESPYRVAYIDEPFILQQIQEAKSMADCVLVSMHWGAEDSMKVEDWQRELAQKIANAGADLIIGHHPHVLRSVEWITRSDGSKMLCAYSLGNFISTQMDAPNLLGGILNVTLNVGASPYAQTESVEFTPTIAEYNASRSSVQITPLSEMTDARLLGHGAKPHDSRISVAYYQTLLEQLRSAPNSAI